MEEVSRLQEIRARLEAKVERLSRQYGEAKKQHESVVTALELLADPSTKGFRESEIRIEIGEVQGKTLKQALLYVAEKCGGTLKVTPARKFLIDADVVRNGQSGSNRINTALMEMAEFERIRRGKYRLVDESKSSEKKPRFNFRDDIDEMDEQSEYEKIMRKESST